MRCIRFFALQSGNEHEIKDMGLKRFLKLGPVVLFKKIIGFEEVYTIGIRPLDSGAGTPYRCVPYKKDYWYADPLTFEYGGKHYLFTEAYDRKKALGSIAVSVIDERGHISKPRIIIRENYHMSYPYVFLWNGGIYMIPETSSNMTINLYRCVEFPLKWKLEAQMRIDEVFVDADVFVMGDNELCLLGSAVNRTDPLKVRYSRYRITKNGTEYSCRHEAYGTSGWNYYDRNAGKPVIIGGTEYMPSQESSETDYGIKINFRKIKDGYSVASGAASSITLDNACFAAGIHRRNMIGVHTYSRIGKFEIIDLRYYKFSIDTNLRRLGHIFTRFVPE